MEGLGLGLFLFYLVYVTFIVLEKLHFLPLGNKIGKLWHCRNYLQ